MRFTKTQSFPVPVKKAWDYVNDFRTWPDWYAGMQEIRSPELAAWSRPGDKVGFSYKLLGRRIEGECTLEEVREAEFLRFTASVPALGDFHFEWRWTETDDGVKIESVLETAEPTTFFEKAIDKTIIPRVLGRDLERTFENLEQAFAFGVPE